MILELMICFIRKLKSEKLNYLCIHMNKNKNEGKNRILKESKNTSIERICKSEALYFFKCCIQIKLEKTDKR